jgi:hypothetical protein
MMWFLSCSFCVCVINPVLVAIAIWLFEIIRLWWETQNKKFVVFCAARDKVSKLLNAARDGNLQMFKGNQILFPALIERWYI